MQTMNALDTNIKNRALNASQGELTLMLYEGAIVFCDTAIKAYENNDMDMADINIQKTDRIIEELENTLNEKYEVSKNFHEIYSRIRSCLKHGKEDRDLEFLHEALKHLRIMCDIWKDVMKRTA